MTIIQEVKNWPKCQEAENRRCFERMTINCKIRDNTWDTFLDEERRPSSIDGWLMIFWWTRSFVQKRLHLSINFERKFNLICQFLWISIEQGKHHFHLVFGWLTATRIGISERNAFSIPFSKQSRRLWLHQSNVIFGESTTQYILEHLGSYNISLLVWASCSEMLIEIWAEA